ncbi:type II toxin-antitoxin system VapC family toxin [Iningainema tapete]|uniref:Type II toxin-antitoxin system VapC family toxin n=1 Tax=Iningainema tapete BLCC-T55 TaxID=2748662 RepID=A0A8J7CBR9_9CYAN|nr:PIN domain-containing protein [Iningainema tapete]MBD2771915.1 type II toxin-antitoxin system VapC family toxin [Iningainema tapete BLCC-T55]
MSYLVDTNVLVRLVHRVDPMHPHVQSAYTVLQTQGEILYIIPQNLIEFWVVATRPTSTNGLGLTLTEASQELSILKDLFQLKPDISTIFVGWEQLVAKHQVMGKPAHDTRLVAAMIAHKLSHLLTFNTNDFKRFSEITVVDPRSISSLNHS